MMTLTKAKKLAQKTLDVLHPLFIGIEQPTDFSTIILGAFRRDYLTLYTIEHLSNCSKEQQAAFGDSCVDLSRRVFEDLINVEYIKTNGKDKYTKQFKDFMKREAYKEMLYLQQVGSTKLTKELVQKTKEEYNSLQSKLKKRNRWSGPGIEDMIDLLLKKKEIGEDEFRTLSQTYIAGNYKNHFSPSGIFPFLHNETYESMGENDMRLSLIVVAVIVTKLASELITESDSKRIVKKKVDDLWRELSTIHG